MTAGRPFQTGWVRKISDNETGDQNKIYDNSIIAKHRRFSASSYDFSNFRERKNGFVHFFYH